EDAYKRLIAPSIEREVRSELTGTAEEQAIKVFSANLRNLLLQPPVRGKVVLGVDPGYRTGCKWAVVDDTGKLLEVGVIYPHPPQNKRDEAKTIISSLVKRYDAEIIAIGNGTASRETEAVVAETIKEGLGQAQYILVSEAGASVYSASKLAGEEFPELDLSMRSAASIARRLQDPLAELVKIEPKAVGVGQYQHDVSPKRLEESLGGVVESCVNSVGVDLNTASASLLQHIAGLKPGTAKNIVALREKKGRFRLRSQLKEVPRLGEQTFVQCAGFLRIPGGENPLENTPVHPESYPIAEAVLAKVGYRKEDLLHKKAELKHALNSLDAAKVAAELGAGVPTVKDIIFSLQRPGRDPRDELPKPLLHSDITTLESLKPGMVLQGTVRNVVDFGAFVDIGVKQDGLVHISQLSEKFVKHPMDAVAVGDIVKVKVLQIDLTRQRVSLSMKDID
ncbi:MAG: helix-hairpin-helix domain-containing protein, partial [Firmicutes bacterium]|nr:helix-hairpin-helix domain-containing protein [Bacillota bacterium]